MSDELVIQCCSPTLAGLKTGSMFSCPYTTAEELTQSVRRLNRKLAGKGIRVLPLRVMENRALVYLYRPQKLQSDFSRREVRDILDECGYASEGPDRCVVRLIRKLRGGKEFPHEVGLFLGYPPEDVRGFMENGAAHYKYSGYWKVYGDPQEARKTFAKYKKCTQIYREMWKKGRSVEQLAVAGA